MAYSIGGKVEAVDYNTFANAAANINAVWASGSGTKGYGQPAIANVATGDKITSSQWTTLVDSLNKVSRHQVGANTAIANTQTEVGDKVVVLNGVTTAISNAIANINTVGNTLIANTQGASTATTFTNGTTWSNFLTANITVAFGSADQIRWFFNSGGQIQLSFSHPTATAPNVNQIISSLCTAVGTITLSSPSSGSITIAGSTFNGVTKTGGSGSPAVLATNTGYHALTTTSTPIFQQLSGSTSFSSQYSGTFISIAANVNGSGSLTLFCTIDEVQSVGPGLTVSSGTAVICTIRQPETTNLTNTWGSPTPTNSFTAV